MLASCKLSETNELLTRYDIREAKFTFPVIDLIYKRLIVVYSDSQCNLYATLVMYQTYLDLEDNQFKTLHNKHQTEAVLMLMVPNKVHLL